MEKAKIIGIDLFNRDILVCFGSKDFLVENLSKYVDDTECTSVSEDINVGTSGRSIMLSGGQIVLWMPSLPESGEELGTLSHEIFHVAVMVMKKAGVGFCADSEEVFAYLIGYITKNVTEMLTSDGVLSLLSSDDASHNPRLQNGQSLRHDTP